MDGLKDKAYSQIPNYAQLDDVIQKQKEILAKLEALRLACGRIDENPEEIVERAKKYYAFLKGE